MPSANMLIRFTVLPEMHIQMLLHLILTERRIRESQSTLFTLNRQAII